LLSNIGLALERAETCQEGLIRVLTTSIDLVVLAENTPPINGDEPLTALHRLSAASIVVLGRGGEHESINALNLGADIYFSMPRDASILAAKVKSLIWRRQRNNIGGSVALGLRFVSNLQLSVTERKIVMCLLVRRGKIATSRELLQEVWGGRVGYSTVKTHLRQLKHKLDQSSGMEFITVVGVGHRLKIDSNSVKTILL
jgi:DNA-binding response OmpR family regulator